MNIFNFLDQYARNNSTLTYGDILEADKNEGKIKINPNNFLNNEDRDEYNKYHQSNLSRLQRFG